MLAELHPLAETELTTAALDYHAQAPGLGADFLAEFDAVLAFLGRFPHIGRTLPDGSRRLSLERFPYHVIYRAQADRLLILAVAHHRRRPGYASGRG